MLVGLGASRLRSLFASAKTRSPAVIFIDEIDSVGAKRVSTSLHPYANQTVNQLLAEMDGFEATRRIRARSDSIAGLPIVAMTANAMQGDRDACLSAGMNDYISKPINIEKLSAAISRINNKSETARAPAA